MFTFVLQLIPQRCWFRETGELEDRCTATPRKLSRPPRLQLSCPKTSSHHSECICFGFQQSWD